MRPPLPDVPDAGPDATVDPAVADALRDSPLPSYYMPASMPGLITGWRRGAAWTVVVMLVTTASAGLCVTYGPEELWRAFGSFWR